MARLPRSLLPLLGLLLLALHGASAFARVSIQNPASGFFTVTEQRIGETSLASADRVEQKSPLTYELASDFAVAARGTAQVTLNRAAGNAFRDQLAGRLQQAGRQVETEVYKRTPFGKRYMDIEVSMDGKILGGIETKVGSSRYTPLQQLKDWWLTNIENYPVNVARQP